MKKIYILLMILIFATSFTITYYIVQSRRKINDTDSGSKGSQPENIQHTSPEDQPQDVDKDGIRKKIKEMTLEEKVGQMVIAGIDGYGFDDNSRRLIEEKHIGGFIVLGQNVKNTSQLLTLVNSLKEANLKNNIPLFISVDQEGGRVDRMPAEFQRYPTNKAIGQRNDKEFSYNIGKTLADEIKAFGFNMDFAPVLDINSNPRNPVIGDRSFGTEAGLVSGLGVQTMKGIQAESIIPVVKHFPGHGDTSVDSHVGLPLVNNSLERLESFELIPFKDAIGSGADMVMVAHILLPRIDSVNPASFSKPIITDILRNRLGFTGVVITDDMTMGAVVKNYDIGDAAVKSVTAGTDIILVAHDYGKETAVIDALIAAAEKGTLSTERIDESVYRILKLKEKYKLSDSVTGKVNVQAINNEIKNAVK